MKPNDVIQSIIRALEDSGEFTGGSYIDHEFDPDKDNRVTQPIVSFEIQSNPRADEWDSDFVKETYDTNGNKKGRLYRPSWEMQLNTYIIVAAGHDDYDATDLGGDFVHALLPYENQMFNEGFPDGSGGEVEEIDAFRIGNGQRQDDLAGPGLRQWQQELFVTWYHPIEVTYDRVTEVHTPVTSEMSIDSSGVIEWEYTV